VKRRALNILIATDQFLFCILSLGHYSPDETLSAAAWRWETQGIRAWPRQLIDWLFSIVEQDHCRLSFEAERSKRQLPSAYR
jgi:hypothetical protein